MIGGVVDLDLLFQIPQEYARIMGGMERKKTFEVQQWSRRERANRMVGPYLLKEEEGIYIVQRRKLAV